MVDLSQVDAACAAAFGETVTITPKYQASFTATAIVRRGERVEAFSGHDFAAPALVAEIRKSDWPAAERGARVDLAEGCCTVDHVGQDDAGVAWLLDLKKTA